MKDITHKVSISPATSLNCLYSDVVWIVRTQVSKDIDPYGKLQLWRIPLLSSNAFYWSIIVPLDYLRTQ